MTKKIIIPREDLERDAFQLSITEMSQKYKCSNAVINRLMKEYEIVVPKEIKDQLMVKQLKKSMKEKYGVVNAGYLQESKEKTRQFWKENKKEIGKKISERQLENWKNRSSEEREKIASKIRTSVKNYWKDAPEEQKEEHKKRAREETKKAFDEMDEEQKERMFKNSAFAKREKMKDPLYRERVSQKISNGRKLAWDKTSSETKQRRMDRLQKDWKKWWANLSEEEKQKFRNKTSKGTKKAFDEMTEEKKIEMLKNSSLAAAEHFRGSSSQEEEIFSFIQSIYKGPILRRDWTIGKELDFYFPELKLAIEYNGMYWHSNFQQKDKYYHRNKVKLARDKGIRLIHIWEWEWLYQKEMIKTFLKFVFSSDVQKIYARNCEIREVPKKDYYDYCRKNHLQGAKAGTEQLVVYGLYYQNELVQLMSFDKPTRSKKYEWEIIRGCPGSMNHVIGGNSKLFTHFLKERNPNNVMSKCDMDKFDGRGYFALGMKLESWSERKYDVFWKNGIWKATSYQPRQEKNRLQRQKDMEEGYGLEIYSAGTEEFVWTRP